MILYENMKPIEHFLLHLICVRHQLMRACKQRNAKLSLFIEHIEVADEFITSQCLGIPTALLRVFSDMNFIKNELRICMTNENIHHCFRLAVITLEPKLKELARSKKCHFSHQQNNK